MGDGQNEEVSASTELTLSHKRRLRRFLKDLDLTEKLAAVQSSRMVRTLIGRAILTARGSLRDCLWRSTPPCTTN